MHSFHFIVVIFLYSGVLVYNSLNQGWKKYFPIWDQRSDIKILLQTEIACGKKQQSVLAAI